MYKTQILGWCFLVVYLPIVLIFSFLFQNRVHKFPIFARFPAMVVFANMYTFGHICIAVAYLTMDSPQWVCVVNRWAVYLGFPVYANAYLMRCWYLFFTFRLQKSILKLHDSLDMKADIFIQNMYWKRKVRLSIVYFIIIGIAIAIFIPLAERAGVYKNNNCLKANFELVAAGLCFSYAVLIIVFGFLLWGVKENMFIKLELKIVGVIWIATAFTYVLGVILSPSADQKNWETAFYAAVPTAEFLAFTVSTVMPVIVSYRHKKTAPASQESSSSSFNSLDFSSVLEDKILHQKFQEFLCQEFCVENLLFWEAVNAYKFSTSSEVQQEAAEIYEKYIKEGSTFQVNIDGITLEEIKQEIDSASASRNTFDKAQKQIYVLLKMSVFPRFESSLKTGKPIGV